MSWNSIFAWRRWEDDRMNAMILAAGRGERMRPLTDDCPKPLLPIDGVPLIEYHLKALATNDIEHVVINTSWLGDKIGNALGDGSRFGLHIDYSPEPDALETAGGIVQALDLLDDEFIVINGDVFTDFDISQLELGNHQAQLVLVPNPTHNPKGDFAIENGLLSNAEQNRYTFAGIGVYRKSLFSALEPGKRALAPILRSAADRGDIGACVFLGLWSDVGTPQRLQQLQSR
jgi:MurNAc alpha-1-phosphate uridylyltransferase